MMLRTHAKQKLYGTRYRLSPFGEDLGGVLIYDKEKNMMMQEVAKSPVSSVAVNGGWPELSRDSIN